MRAILLDLDFALELTRDAIKLGDHRLDLGDLPPFLVDLKLLQPVSVLCDFID